MTVEEDNNRVSMGINIPIDLVTQLEALTSQMKQVEEIVRQLEAENTSLKTKYASLLKKDEIDSESCTEEVVTPWEVPAKDGGKIDYDKLIDKFGCKRIDEPLIDRVQRLTCREPHVFLRRGFFFAHRFESLAKFCF